MHHVTAAYNIQTKEARIYAEFERVGEKVIEDNMKNMGAGSIVIDSFSSEDWERSSEIAFRSVVECGEKAGFTLIRHGNEPGASTGQAAGGSGASTGGMGGRASSDEEEEEPRPRNDERHKRQRTASPDGGRGMEYFEAAMEKMTSTFPSTVASAMSSAIANAEQRREKLERQLHELQLKEERRRIEEEVAGKYKAEIDGLKAKVDSVDRLKEEHAAAMKEAKDEQVLQIETARK